VTKNGGLRGRWFKVAGRSGKAEVVRWAARGKTNLEH
jgi:hypothetical protein